LKPKPIWLPQWGAVSNVPPVLASPPVLTSPQEMQEILGDQVLSTNRGNRLPTWLPGLIVLKPRVLKLAKRSQDVSPCDQVNSQTQTTSPCPKQPTASLMDFVLTNPQRDRFDPVQIDPVQIDPVQIDPVQIDPVQIDPVQIDPVLVGLA
jgi:hypothetical protein